MKKHKKADVSSNINPVPMTQTTNKMYGLLALAALLLGVTTLGSIGDGVDGSTEKNNSMNQMNRKKCEIYSKCCNYDDSTYSVFFR